MFAGVFITQNKTCLSLALTVKYKCPPKVIVHLSSRLSKDLGTPLWNEKIQAPHITVHGRVKAKLQHWPTLSLKSSRVFINSPQCLWHLLIFASVEVSSISFHYLICDAVLYAANTLCYLWMINKAGLANGQAKYSYVGNLNKDQREGRWSQRDNM